MAFDWIYGFVSEIIHVYSNTDELTDLFPKSELPVPNCISKFPICYAPGREMIFTCFLSYIV